MDAAIDALVEISADGVTLEGHLVIPDDPVGVVCFAHGSGSSRQSTRNRFVAEQLRDRRLATLTQIEAATSRLSP